MSHQPKTERDLARLELDREQKLRWRSRVRVGGVQHRPEPLSDLPWGRRAGLPTKADLAELFRRAGLQRSASGQLICREVGVAGGSTVEREGSGTFTVSNGDTVITWSPPKDSSSD